MADADRRISDDGLPSHPGGSASADHRLSTMFEIASILATEHDLDAMVSKLLVSLVETLETAEAGILLLYDPAEGCLKPKAAQGYDLGILRKLRIAPNESRTGKAFSTGKTELYPTPEITAAAMSTLTPANRAILTAAAVRKTMPQSSVCIPLINSQVKIGVLLLESFRQSGSFTSGDLAFLEPIADLLALSIENTRLRQELDAIRSLSEANRLKAEVISTLAHEMRTPLTSIKGYSTALLMDDASFSVETQREFLQIIDEECDVLQDLVHDLLESSIIDAGFLKLEVQPVQASRLAREVLEEIAHLSRKHRYLVDIAPQFPVLDADPRRIRQVLRNLLDNAVKYSPNGGLVVVRGEVLPDEVVISVADQGEGIAPEHLNRLFEKFFRIRSGLGRHVVGTGLGLPIARTIVEAHGGRIWAESVVGQGTTFYFTLPRSGSNDAAEDGSTGGQHE